MGKCTVDHLEEAWTYCKQYIPGWAKLKREDAHVEPICGGLSNLLFICKVPGHQPEHGVLVRVHGEKTSQMIDRVADTLVSAIMGERGLGPKLLGMFEKGRIEDFLPFRTLKTPDLKDKQLQEEICAMLAKVHSLMIPLPKSPVFFRSLERFMAVAKDTDFEDAALQAKVNDLISRFDMVEEIEFLRNYIGKGEHTVCFCHNDLQEGNILVDPANPGDVRFIDFEYSAYNYRMFDFANHFIEHAIDYNYPEYPYFKITLENFPTHDEMQSWLETYIATRRKLGVDEKMSVEGEIAKMPAFVAATHLYWSVWSLSQAAGEIEFGYLEYAEERMILYQEWKKSL
eukprot:Clim_evm50s191 gene=Clim_evmTU50s191